LVRLDHLLDGNVEVLEKDLERRDHVAHPLQQVGLRISQPKLPRHLIRNPRGSVSA
jgi:hypothetical protein